MEIGQRLAKNVKRLRDLRGWSQEELGEQAGFHRTYISQVERAVKNPTIIAVESLAIALGVSAGELLAEPDQAPVVQT